MGRSSTVPVTGPWQSQRLGVQPGQPPARIPGPGALLWKQEEGDAWQPGEVWAPRESGAPGPSKGGSQGPVVTVSQLPLTPASGWVCTQHSQLPVSISHI